MALIKHSNSETGNRGALAGALLGILRRYEDRRVQAALAGKPERLLRDMGVDPAAIHADAWDYELSDVQAIGNRP
ncbi:MAG: hypothetical protein KIT43_03455 [Bauldia sp.]|nr:hypothetical protein [Bauldia sp.]MCW5717737.1 hypothetical protein [Bauldia sp.]